jgi:membrane protease YdiL (CAAX protease family)
MPTSIDFIFVALFTVVIALFETLVFWPRFKAAVDAGRADARRNAYRRAIIGQWFFAALAVLLWATTRRPWRGLGVLLPSSPTRLLVSVLLVAIVALFVAVQTTSVRRAPADVRRSLRPRLGSYTFLLPHTPREYRWFLCLAVTAGVCEELLYRGYLVWVLQPFLGLGGAVVASVVLFGAAHAYQGRAGAIKATIAGAVMGVIVVACGWVVPAMLVHALVDLSAGVVGYAILTATEPLDPAA